MSGVGVAASLLVRVLKGGGKILVAGNGGSASAAQHFAAELIGRFEVTRPPLPAIALTDPVAMSAIGNDFGFEEVFARQVEAFGKAGDALVVFSTSGRSPNILQALERARSLIRIGFTGTAGEKILASLCDEVIVAEGITAEIQEGHLRQSHALCRAIEHVLA